MPSTSNKMARTMAAAAHDEEFAEKMGIKQSVAREFNEADAESGRLSRAMKGRRKGKNALRSVRA